ncbi:MAG TPA: MBL fold metallo-hydrolase [Dokdonella sp.]|uniref:MBL fold metallo-hydrolase n=1 Tax=Dokdonella sp. TaxID=2291710 RepID=UPI002D7FD790|nr:MBL fold metallo-hydrolase [Dokdonella sp.]HET9034134.1 MBL fold metallo-hydrolase [Dokdonella sp.]
MRIRLILAILFLATCGAASAHDISASASYLGNEGVLVARGKTKVVFDAFYADSYGTYSLVPDSIRSALLKGTPPYDGIDAVFVSHVHGDHFTASHAVAFLRAHRKVKLFGSTQTFDALVEEVGKEDPLLKRIVSVDLGPDDAPKSFDINGLQIEVVAIPHAGGKSRASIQNLSWRVTLDKDTTVLHLGDADTRLADFEKHAAHFAARHATAAFPPYWFFDSAAGKSIIDTYLNADQIIGIHVPAAAIGHGDAWRERAGGDLFTDPGESRKLD